MELRIVAARSVSTLSRGVLAVLLSLPASTIRALIHRWDCRGWWRDRITGEIVRAGGRASGVRYQGARPGVLRHVDVKTLGKVPRGGGWRTDGRSEGVRGHGLGWGYRCARRGR